MSISYLNRKGQTYFLCQGTTKTGRPRYYFTRKSKDKLMDKIPEGYTIRESVNGIVSLTKAGAVLLLEEEVNVVKREIHAHPRAKDYRVDAKLKQLTIYERVGLDVTNLAVTLGLDPKRREDKEVLQRMHEEERLYARFTPIMRFILTDEEQRHFSAERMRFSGIEHWITIADNGSISRLASTLIPTLGAERFFELI